MIKYILLLGMFFAPYIYGTVKTNISTNTTISPEYFGARGNGITDDTIPVKKAAQYAYEHHIPFEGNLHYKLITNFIPALAMVKRIGTGNFLIYVKKVSGGIQKDTIPVSPKKDMLSKHISARLQPLKTLVGIKNRYAAFPKGVINSKGIMLFSYYFGVKHRGGGNGEARILITRDKGKTWKDYFLAGNLTSHPIEKFTYAYDTAIGVDKNENFIALVSLAERNDLERYVLHSQEGIFWSFPKKIHFGTIEGSLYKNAKRNKLTHDPATGKSEIVFFGNIKKTTDNKLVVIAYIANNNWLAISEDGLGDMWDLHLIREPNDNLRISEMALGVCKDNKMLAIARIDGSVSSMYQYYSKDGGYNWTAQGYTNLEKNGGNIPQNIECISRNNIRYFELDKGQRSSKSAPAKYQHSYIRDRIKVHDAALSSTSWKPNIYIQHFLQNDDLGEEKNAFRDYYTTGITDPISKNILVVIHEETKSATIQESKIKTFTYKIDY